MRSKLPLMLALLSPMASAAPALALNSARTLDVIVEGLTVGRWTLRNRVIDTGNTCRYTVRWHSLSGGAPLGRTTFCRIDEYKAGDNFDCEANRRTEFDTLIAKAPGTCRGFDDFGQQTSIDTLVGGQDSGGQITGIIVYDSIGDVQNLVIR